MCRVTQSGVAGLALSQAHSQSHFHAPDASNDQEANHSSMDTKHAHVGTIQHVRRFIGVYKVPPANSKEKEKKTLHQHTSNTKSSKQKSPSTDKKALPNIHKHLDTSLPQTN